MKPQINNIKLITITRPYFDLHVPLNSSDFQDPVNELENFDFEGKNNNISEEFINRKGFITSNTILNTISFMNKCSYRKYILDCLTLNKLIPSDTNNTMKKLINEYFQKNYFNKIETNNNSLTPFKIHFLLEDEERKSCNFNMTNEKLFHGKTKLKENRDIKDLLLSNLVNKKQQFFFIDISEFSKEFQTKELYFYINLVKTKKKDCKLVLFICDKYDANLLNDLINELIEYSYLVILDNKNMFERVLSQAQMPFNYYELDEVNNKIILYMDNLKSFSFVKLENSKIVNRFEYNIGLGLKLQNLKALINYFHTIKSIFIGGFLSKLFINEIPDNCFSTAIYALKKFIDVINIKDFSILNKPNFFIKEKYTLYRSINDVSNQPYPMMFRKIENEFGIRTLASILNTESKIIQSISPKNYNRVHGKQNKKTKNGVINYNLIIKKTNITLPNINENKSLNINIVANNNKFKLQSPFKCMGLFAEDNNFAPFKKIIKLEDSYSNNLKTENRINTSSDFLGIANEKTNQVNKIQEEYSSSVRKLSNNKIGIIKNESLGSSTNVNKFASVTFEGIKTGYDKIFLNEGIYVPNKNLEFESKNC